jgi:hypothetical protein
MAFYGPPTHPQYLRHPDHANERLARLVVRMIGQCEISRHRSEGDTGSNEFRDLRYSSKLALAHGDHTPFELF